MKNLETDEAWLVPHCLRNLGIFASYKMRGPHFPERVVSHHDVTPLSYLFIFFQKKQLHGIGFSHSRKTFVYIGHIGMS